MTTEQTIPLNRLVTSKANVRRTGKAEGIGELAASIAAHGLRQNLNVLPAPDGKRFEVVAGGRRLKALKLLAKEGRIAKDAPIACLVLDESDDPAEISLAENAVRSAMHPDDQFEAFRALIDGKGLSVEDVAARFGVTPAVVRQRLKLTAVSPKLRAIYRKGGMTLDHVMALAISDDPVAQEKAWADLPDWNRDPATLKDALTQDTVPMSDRLARFVGMEAYVAAGGAVLRDLFDAADAGYLTDRALLTRLAMAKMEAAVASLSKEGWKWIRPELTRDFSIHYDRIWGVVPDMDEDDESEEAAEPTFTPEDKARAGVRVTLTHDGTLDIERGLIHPDDAKAEATHKRGDKAAAPAGSLSGRLVEELTAHRTAALRIELARNPAVALAATVHALGLSVLYPGSDASCLDLRAASEPLERHTEATGDSPAHQAMVGEGERWGDRLPGDPADLFAWCLDQPQEALLDLLAYVTALSVDAVQGRYRPSGGLDHADRLADALGLDMAQWWNPSVEGFYGRLSKATLTAIVSEAHAPISISISTTKKPEAARYVAKAMASTGWLPEVLRPAGSVALAA